MLTRIVVRNLFKVLVLVLFLSIPSLSSAGEAPLEIIKSGTRQVLDIIKGNRAGGTIRSGERRQEILNIVNNYFDFKEMSKRALGRPWRDLSASNQGEFAKLFKELLFNTYIDKVELYATSNENILYEGQQMEGDYALVKTQMLAASKNASAQVDYRLLFVNGEWRVYDVVVEGISLINNFRQQFNSILVSQSFDSLLKLMREKVSSQG